MSVANPRRTQPVPLILGPTGAGKTDLALRLAERHNLEIVSVDSAMVYRGMDIGTGKPSAEVLQRHPHHLVDILDPLQAYSAGQFVRDARRAIDDIRARGKLPLLVGGTMLYFRALRRGLADMPAADPAVRAAIDAEAAQRGWPALHAELAAVDPAAARRIRSKRIVQAPIGVSLICGVVGSGGSPLAARRRAREPCAQQVVGEGPAAVVQRREALRSQALEQARGDANAARATDRLPLRVVHVGAERRGELQGLQRVIGRWMGVGDALDVALPYLVHALGQRVAAGGGEPKTLRRGDQ